MVMNNLITTWIQGRFIDQPQYHNWTQEEKEDTCERERHLVRPGPTDNAICYCQDPQVAEWIADRLNLAAKLEQMTEDMQQDRVDVIQDLCDALRSVYAIAGEDEQISNIVNSALEKHDFYA